MPTLAQTLATTTPVSPLLRKARRLGIHGVDAMIALAVSRGCLHYARDNDSDPIPLSSESLGDDELTILLLIGENVYEPTAIRCAAQLARSPSIDPVRLAQLARMEKCERVLTHIARAGVEHDPDGASFWHEILSHLPLSHPNVEHHLPHWSRFVSMPGLQRTGVAPTRWLVPQQ